MSDRILTFSQGETIIDEHSAKTSMYILLEGNVEIFTSVAGEKIILGILEAEAHQKPFFGEMAMLFNIKRTATVSAVNDVKVMEIQNEKELTSFFKKSPDFALKCFKELSERLYDTTKKFLKSKDDVDYLKIRLSNKKNRFKI